VAEVEEFFARMCHEIDLALGEPAGCRWFLNFWDQAPRDVVRRELLPEVSREQARRSGPSLLENLYLDTDTNGG
jgi:hypothetical protein